MKDVNYMVIVWEGVLRFMNSAASKTYTIILFALDHWCQGKIKRNKLQPHSNLL